jgi:SAM-dependent methyltransferase
MSPASDALPDRVRSALLCGLTFLEGGLVASALPHGKNAEFYDQFFDEALSPEASRRTLWNRVKVSGPYIEHDDPFREVLDLIQSRVGSNALVVEIGGGVYQSRSAFAYKRFPNYVPLDLSGSGICRYARTFKRFGIIADATQIPMQSESVDAVFTRTFLEHIPDPNAAVREIFRIVRPGGIIIHEDAWFCRWWQRHAIVGLIPWHDMTMRERALFVASRVTEWKPIRAFQIIRKRVMREVVGRRDPTLRFVKLQPNYELRLGCDEDAAASIDPAEVARVYRALGCSVGELGSVLARVTFRGRRLVIDRGVAC